MKPLSLVGTRNGKAALRWPALLARFAAYFVIVGLVVGAVTWVSDLIQKTHDIANLTRLLTIPGFLAAFFVIHDLRRDLKRRSEEPP